MFSISLPWWEFVVRGLVVYIMLLILLRIVGRKSISQMTPFDLVLLLILSNAVQNSMNGGDNSLVGGLIIAFVLVASNELINYLVIKNKGLAILVEGKPEILVHNGKVFRKLMQKERITDDDLKMALRMNGLMNLEEVEYAIIESTGHISVIPLRPK